MDPFAYHPPGLSPARWNHPLSPAHLTPADDPAAPAYARPGSSSGAGPSTGFTQTLPPLQEHTSGESNGDTGGRPTLVGFEQLTGGDPHVGVQVQDYDGEGTDEHPLEVAFRDPFPRTASSSLQLQHDPSAYGGHAHPFFNPHPNVNARNTRPMTAPSGPSYFHGPSYSAAPSAFYASAQQTSADAASTYDALNLAPAAPIPLAPTGPSGGLPPPPPSGFQYQVDTSPNLVKDYESFRARGFSLPDVGLGSAGAGSTSDPLSAGPEGASPTSSSTPFFYTPPSIPPGGARRAQYSALATAAPAGYYQPGALDPLQGAMAAPLIASTSAILPPASDLPPPPGTAVQSARRSSTGSKQYNFVQQAGQTSKRPRRRYDEIERMYNCDYPGCTKAYGTLNHLNSHKMMQKHGPKSTPAQFKEMRKAWRERKKAEAAAAARARAAQPQPPAMVPPVVPAGLPNVLAALPGHLGERPRPSTSAGEYHLSMSAPFMTPLGAPMLAYPQQPHPTSMAHHAPHTQGMFDAPQPQYGGGLGGGGGYGQPQLAHDPYGLRPVTAPSYYVAPQFGSAAASAGAAAHPLAQSQYVPQRLVSGHAGGTGGTYGAAASADRRFSLPSASLGGYAPQQEHHAHQAHQPHAQHATLEMPRPVLAGPAGYSALIHGGVTAAQAASGGPGADSGVASLGLGAGAGGAARLVLGGAGGEDGGAAEEVAAQ